MIKSSTHSCTKMINLTHVTYDTLYNIKKKTMYDIKEYVTTQKINIMLFKLYLFKQHSLIVVYSYYNKAYIPKYIIRNICLMRKNKTLDN